MKRLLAILLLFSLMLSGCTSTEKAPSAEEIRDRSLDAYGGVNTYFMDISNRISSAGGLGAIDVTAQVEVDKTNQKLHTVMLFGAMGMGARSEEYIIGTKHYTKAADGDWYAEELAADVWETGDVASLERELLRNISVTYAGSEKLEGVDCYIIESRPDAEDVYSIIQTQMGDIPEDAMPSAESIKEVYVKEYVAKDTYLIKRSETRIVLDYQGQTLTIESKTNFANYGQPIEIELPEDAKNAKESIAKDAGI